MKPIDPPAIVHQHFDEERVRSEGLEAARDGKLADVKRLDCFLLAGDRFRQIKAHVGHGKWEKYHADNLASQLGLREVQYYMAFSEAVEKARSSDGSTEINATRCVFDLGAIWKETTGREDGNGKPVAPGLFGQSTEPWPKDYKPCRHHRINPKKWAPTCKKCVANNKSSDAPTTNGSTSAAGMKPSGSGATAEGQGGPSAGPDVTDYLAFWKRTSKTLAKRLHQMRVALVIPPQQVKAAREAFRTIEEFIKGNAEARVRPPEEAVCKKCGETVTWVTTVGHKRMPLDKGKGPYQIMPDGLAVQVEDETGAKGKEGRACHYLRCVSNKPIE